MLLSASANSDDTAFYPNREEIEKQKAKERYMKMHLAGKTEQAKADLARLAIIRKQREEAARKKEEERKGKPESVSPTTVTWLLLDRTLNPACEVGEAEE